MKVRDAYSCDRKEKKMILDSNLTTNEYSRTVRSWPSARRYRPNIIISEVSAAIARRDFGFTSVSRGALGQQDIGGGWLLLMRDRWHRGRGTLPRYENKIRLAVAERESVDRARSPRFRAPTRDASAADTRDLRRYNIDILI